MLHPGLCEQVINNALTRELAEIPEARKAVAPIDKAEASKVLAQYLADVIQKGLDNVLDNGGDISAQIELSNRIVNLIQSTTKEPDFAALGVDERAEQLFALLRKADPRLAVGKTAANRTPFASCPVLFSKPVERFIFQNSSTIVFMKRLREFICCIPITGMCRIRRE